MTKDSLPKAFLGLLSFDALERTPETHSEPGESLRLTLALPEQIAKEISQRIVSGIYQPGQRLLEQSIAQEFTVSRGPVREALRLLEKDGLVAILPRRGAQVTKLTISEVREIFDIRAALNGLRDRLIAEDHGRPHQTLLLIEAGVKKLKRLAQEPSCAEQYVNTVFTLNQFLNEASRNQRLRMFVNMLGLQTLRYSRLGLATAQRRQQSAQYWQHLVIAIREHNGKEAQRISEERVRASRDAAIRALEKSFITN
jgi:DNA-binding GntR family transcriptional regulator